MADKFLDNYGLAVKNARTKQELNAVLNKLYEAGFEDGANEDRE